MPIFGDSPGRRKTKRDKIMGRSMRILSFHDFVNGPGTPAASNPVDSWAAPEVSEASFLCEVSLFSAWWLSLYCFKVWRLPVFVLFSIERE
jgi:hypothetical protein